MKRYVTLREISLIILLLLAFVYATMAQTYTLKPTDSEMKIYGTSNIHDWEMWSEDQQGTLTLREGSFDLQTLQVTYPAEGLKSGKGGMDKNTYKALKTDSHKNITFRLHSVTSVKETGDGEYECAVQGDLKIAGKSRTVPLMLKAVKKGSTLVLSGEKSLRMTDFGVEPPKALMGTIKTGDEVTLKFKAAFSK